MKKEVIIAIIFGIIIGLIVTFGIRIAQKAVDQPINEAVAPTQTPTAATSPTPTGQLVITQPSPATIASEEIIEIKGNATPNSFISFVSEEFQTAAAADEAGNFIVEFELISGPNTILVTSHQPDGSKLEQIIEVVYSTVELDNNQPTPTINPESEEDDE